GPSPLPAPAPLRASSPPRRLRRGDHRDGLDLDECVLPEQPPDLHGRAGRWLPGVDILVADLPHDGELGGVDQVEVELDDLLEAGSDRLEGGAEVVEHLTGLGADVAGADKRPRRVQGDLAVADAGLSGPGWHLVEGVV